MQEILKDETGGEGLAELLAISILTVAIVAIHKIWKAWPQWNPATMALAVIAGVAFASLVMGFLRNSVSTSVAVRGLLSAAVKYALLLLNLTVVTAIFILAIRFPVFGIAVLLFLVEVLRRSMNSRKASV